MMSLELVDINYELNQSALNGNLTGDSVLKEFSGCLKESLRESDFVVRYGSEEFVKLLHNA